MSKEHRSTRELKKPKAKKPAPPSAASAARPLIPRETTRPDGGHKSGKGSGV